MKKIIILLLILLSRSFAQEFSAVLASTDTYLNFESSKDDLLPIYIDEATSLAWQNSEKLQSFKESDAAKLYCKSLKLGDHKWVLPTFKELKSLTARSNIVFGHELSFLASDRPIWDNTLTLAYNAQNSKKLYVKQDQEDLFVRCVSRLEE